MVACILPKMRAGINGNTHPRRYNLTGKGIGGVHIKGIHDRKTRYNGKIVPHPEPANHIT